MSLRFRLQKFGESLAAMKTPFSGFPLLALPNEILILVFEQLEQLDSKRTLCRVATTCHRLCELAEPIIYRSIFFRDGPAARKILSAVHRRAGRGSAVNVLEIPCDLRRLHDFAAISALLGTTTRLKELMLESPHCEGGDFEDERTWTAMTDHLFRQFAYATEILPDNRLSMRPLQELRKLTLHLNGAESPYWTPDAMSFSLFQHPRLLYLKVSCVNILDSLRDRNPNGLRTPLKHLELEECNITRTGLRCLLAIPLALETLHLGENCHNIRHFIDEVDASCNHLFETNPEAVMAALCQQKHSLRCLSYTTTMAYYQQRQLARLASSHTSRLDAGFADFDRLEHVSLVGHCPNFERAVMTSRAPPNLRCLEFRGISPFRPAASKLALLSAPSTRAQELDLIPFLRAPSCAQLPSSLSSINITLETSYEHGTSLGPLNRLARDLIPHAARVLDAALGVVLRVHCRCVARYYPPYLFGEPTPTDELVFGGPKEGWAGRFAQRAGTSAGITYARDGDATHDEDSEWEDEDEDGEEWEDDDDEADDDEMDEENEDDDEMDDEDDGDEDGADEYDE